MPEVYRNLSNQFPIANDAALISSNNELNALSNSLNSLQTNLDSVDSKSNALLTKQESVNTIVTNEKNRLDQKKENIDNAYSSQQRAIYMNDNISKRYNAYSKILIAAVIGAFVLFVIALLQSYLLFIPSFIFIIIYISILSGVLIYSISIYVDIRKHEQIDYDRIYSRPPPVVPISGAATTAGAVVVAPPSCPIVATTGNGGAATTATSTQQSFQNMETAGTINTEEFTNYSRYT
jgi:hypothetical protein